MKETMTEDEKNELWKDDKFSLEKERKDKVKEDVKLQRDYAETMGQSFFRG